MDQGIESQYRNKSQLLNGNINFLMAQLIVIICQQSNFIFSSIVPYLLYGIIFSIPLNENLDSFHRFFILLTFKNCSFQQLKCLVISIIIQNPDMKTLRATPLLACTESDLEASQGQRNAVGFFYCLWLDSCLFSS